MTEVIAGEANEPSGVNPLGRSTKSKVLAERQRSRVFIDVYAGCGGLSLGLLQSGWKGLFAIEQSPDAFETLRSNLVEQPSTRNGFDWPAWLPQMPAEVGDFLRRHSPRLKQLQGQVDLVAGGPPCQGFSFAGKRRPDDPRNRHFRQHMRLVDLLQPALVLLENVQGMSVAHGKTKWQANGRRGRPRKSYAERLRYELTRYGYIPQQAVVRASDFGVPQTRPRYITVGIREDLFEESNVPDFFALLQSRRHKFLKQRGLPTGSPVTVSQAISDLRVAGRRLISCDDPASPSGFRELASVRPRTNYQKLMHGLLNGERVNSMRLVNHRPDTISRFERILNTCRKGVQLSDADRRRLNIRKSAIVPLSPDKPSHTLTTLPDDLLHYCEPRVHTVREHARLQSFPDWFAFKGKFTTGGERRVRECPRYTQVGNAVPPLLAEAIGETLLQLLYQAAS